VLERCEIGAKWVRDGTIVEVKVLRKQPVDFGEADLEAVLGTVKHDKFDRFGVGTPCVPLTGSEADDVRFRPGLYRKGT